MIEAMIASRSAVKRPSMGFNMPKKHVLAISAVVVVAVAAAWLMPGRSKTPTTGAPANEQAQLPLGQGTPQPNSGGAPAVEFAGNSQPMPLPLVGNSQPVMRGPLAEAAGGITEGDDGVPVEGSSATPPTVTTTAPPAGIQPGPAPAPAPAPAAKPVPAPTPATKPVPAPTQVATAKPAPTAPAVGAFVNIRDLFCSEKFDTPASAFETLFQILAGFFFGVRLQLDDVETLFLEA